MGSESITAQREREAMPGGHRTRVRGRFLIPMLICATATTGCVAQAEAGRGDTVLPGPVPSAVSATAPPEAGKAPLAETPDNVIGLSAPECDPAGIPTVTPRVLTVAAHREVGSPWFTEGGEGGINTAITVKVAEKLGYSHDRLVWVEPSAPHDVEVGAFPDTETAPGTEATAGYAPFVDMLVVRAGGEKEPLRKVGVVAGSTGEQSAKNADAPTVQFTDVDTLLGAILSGQVSSGVVSSADSGTVYSRKGLSATGRFAFTGKGQPEHAVMLVSSHGGLAGCMSGAIDRLRVEGVLEPAALDRMGLPVVEVKR